MARNFVVRDLRNKQFFITDDVFLNGYARVIGPIASMVYISLCRHADKEQTAFPSQELIADEIGVGRRTVIDKVAVLQRHNLIEITRERTTDGKWLRNTSILLDKSQWKKEPSATTAHGQPSANDDITHVQPLHTKYTHTKYTHTLSIGKFSKVENLTDKDLQEIADKYGVPMSFVRSKYDDMVLWVGGRPGSAKLKGRNWKLTLMRWVKSDALKVMEKEKNMQRFQKGGVIDATNL
jgi:hypothetical protein